MCRVPMTCRNGSIRHCGMETPRTTSERPNFPLPCAAIRSSAPMARISPPAMAWPGRAATTGAPKTKICRTRSQYAPTNSSIALRFRPTRRGRSHPPENIPGSAEVSTIARAFALVEEENAAESSSTSSGENALAFGRSRVRTTTGSRVSTETRLMRSSARIPRGGRSRGGAAGPPSARGETSRRRFSPAAPARARRRAAPGSRRPARYGGSWGPG